MLPTWNLTNFKFHQPRVSPTFRHTSSFEYFISGHRRPFETGRLVGQRQKRNHVLAGFPNNFHLSDDIQLLPARYAGMNF